MGITYYELINYLRGTYCKLHQLNIFELLTNMSDYFNINEGFIKYIERMKEAKK